MDDVRKLARIGRKTMVYHLFTTAFAVTIGHILANVTQVGGGFSIHVDATFKFRNRPLCYFNLFKYIGVLWKFCYKNITKQSSHSKTERQKNYKMHLRLKTV